MAAKWYPGFCEKYGMFPVHVAAHGGASALYAAAAWFNSAAGEAINAEASRGILMGGVGIVCAAVTSAGLNRFALAGKGIGISRGGRIVRACQLAAFAAPVAAGLIFNDNAAGHTEPGPDAPVSEEIRAIPAVSPARP